MPRFAITSPRVIILESSYLSLTEGLYTSSYIIQERHKKFKKKIEKTMFSYSNKIRFIGIILFSFLYTPFLGALMLDV